METTLAMLRRVRTDWIDKPSDIGLIVILVALLFAAQYFLPKYFPNLSEKTVKFICYGVMIVVVIIWFAVVGT